VHPAGVSPHLPPPAGPWNVHRGRRSGHAPGRTARFTASTSSLQPRAAAWTGDRPAPGARPATTGCAALAGLIRSRGHLPSSGCAAPA
jgi:hypothetical protein